MSKKILGIMLSIMVIGGFVNDTNTIIRVDNQQSLEVATLGEGDGTPYFLVLETNQEG